VRARPKPLSVGDRAINLTQVLKRAGWASTGGEAKALIADGRIRVNGIIESRKRRKMALGDCVTMDDGPSLILVGNPPLPSD
jgi:ribosome-associated protein